jgi:hypothetical protein
MCSITYSGVPAEKFEKSCSVAYLTACILNFRLHLTYTLLVFHFQQLKVCAIVV